MESDISLSDVVTRESTHTDRVGPHVALDSSTTSRIPKSVDQQLGQAKELESYTPYDPKQTISWLTITWLVGIHVFALAAPWTFTWQALVATLVLHWFTGSIGICLGYHRLLTHSSFQTYRFVRWFFAAAGGLAGEGSAIDWVADHRKHHAHSDKHGDPHSPEDGGLWAHMLWLARRYSSQDRVEHVQKWAPDLWKDAGLRFLDRAFLPVNFLAAVAVSAIGFAIGGWPMAVSFLIWATFVRLVLVLHTTWFVNSASHMWGYRNYETTDNSRNLWWVGLIAYGEGWHNNHHAYPRMAMHGHKWWEIDVTYWAIRCMKKVGLAWDVVDYKQKSIE